MSFDTEVDTVAITRSLLTRVHVIEFAHPQSYIGDLHLALGKGAPAETHEVLDRVATARAELINVLNTRPPVPEAVIGACEAYLPPVSRLIATDFLKVCSFGEEGKVFNPGATRPYVWTSVLDTSARSGIWTARWSVFDTVHVCVALASAHTHLAASALTGSQDAPSIVRASKHMREAAGALNDAATKLLTPWRDYVPPKRAVEMLPALLKCVALSCMAQAQNLAVAKAELEGKPPALLARLCKGTADMFRDGLREVQSGVTPAEYKSLDVATMEFMTVGADVAGALAEKYQGWEYWNKDSGDNYAHGQVHIDKGIQVLAGVKGLTPKNKDLEALIQAEAAQMRVTFGKWKLLNESAYFPSYPSPTDVIDPKPARLGKMPELAGLSVTADPLPTKDPEADAKKMAEAVAVAEAADKAEAAERAAKRAAEESKSAGAGSGAGTTSAAAMVKTIAPAGPKTGNIQLKCANCTSLMQAPAGSKLIKCPGCSRINVNVSCGACTQSLSFLQGASHVECPSCRTVNEVVI